MLCTLIWDYTENYVNMGWIKIASGGFCKISSLCCMHGNRVRARIQTRRMQGNRELVHGFRCMQGNSARIQTNAREQTLIPLTCTKAAAGRMSSPQKTTFGGFWVGQFGFRAGACRMDVWHALEKPSLAVFGGSTWESVLLAALDACQLPKKSPLAVFAFQQVKFVNQCWESASLTRKPLVAIFLQGISTTPRSLVPSVCDQPLYIQRRSEGKSCLKSKREIEKEEEASVNLSVSGLLKKKRVLFI